MSTRITVVPHTHWDREWYLPFEGFLERLVPIVDELLELLDRGYPHFHLDGQTAPVDDYLDARPGREADVRRHAESGRISVGPWLALVDEFLVSGETIVRDLELGLARTRELGGGDAVGYLPDQFGHVGQMPQILAAAGIDRALVWRGVPSGIAQTPFWWESPDGTRVLAEYLPLGYSLGGRLRELEQPEALADALERLAGRLAPFAGRDRVLIMAGMDHAAPDPTLPERLAAARALRPDLEAEIGSIAGHVAAPPASDPPVWRGELRSAARAHLLPGVYSARIPQKQERARIEALVERYAEPLAALVPGFEWPQATLDRIWRLLVLNGAHDSICGCSVDEVARAVDARDAEARAAAEEIVTAALTALGEQVGEPGVVRFNPSTFEREGVPGLGWRVDPAPADTRMVPVEVRLSGVWAAVDGVELAFEDEPDEGDLYNFCPSSGGVSPALGSLTLADGAVQAAFEELDVRIVPSRREGEPFVRLDLAVSNQRPDHRLRLRVRLPRRSSTVVAASPFELVERAAVSEGSELESPSTTWPARGVALAGGIAVLADGVIEYELVSEQELAITLLRCVGTISRASLATRPAPAGPDFATPQAQMLGETRLRLGLLPDAALPDLLPSWERFALPLLSAPATGAGDLARSGTLLAVSGAVLSSVRRRGGVLEARVWNPASEPADAVVGGTAILLSPAEIAVVAPQNERGPRTRASRARS